MAGFERSAVSPMPKVIVKAIQRVTCLRLAPEDRDVWGRYAVEVLETEDEEEMASVALDGFFAFVPMKNPEHFRLVVESERGKHLREARDNRLVTGYAAAIERLPWV
jgi:hypothetical protein